MKCCSKTSTYSSHSWASLVNASNFAKTAILAWAADEYYNEITVNKTCYLRDPHRQMLRVNKYAYKKVASLLGCPIQTVSFVPHDAWYKWFTHKPSGGFVHAAPSTITTVVIVLALRKLWQQCFVCVTFLYRLLKRKRNSFKVCKGIVRLCCVGFTLFVEFTLHLEVWSHYPLLFLSAVKEREWTIS